MKNNFKNFTYDNPSRKRTERPNQVIKGIKACSFSWQEWHDSSSGRGLLSAK